MTTIIKTSEGAREKLVNFCKERDVRKGGVFDVRSAAINVWSRPWLTEIDEAESECLGTLWLKPYGVEIEPGVPVGVLELLGLKVSKTEARDLAGVA